jgi:nitrate reductase beta subunit
LYDADRIRESASAGDAKAVYPAHLDIMLDPNDPKVAEEALRRGISETYLEAARRSPIYRLIKDWRIALPLHPEFRTLPMVWYVPPLSPIAGILDEKGVDAGVDSLRIPIKYLSNLLTAGDDEPVRLALKRLAAMRDFMRSKRLGSQDGKVGLDTVGLDAGKAEAMYRLLALAHLNERFVIPTVRRSEDPSVYSQQGSCGFP